VSERRFRIEFNGDAYDMLTLQWAIDSGFEAIMARKTGRDVFDKNGLLHSQASLMVLERLRQVVHDALWEDVD